MILIKLNTVCNIINKYFYLNYQKYPYIYIKTIYINI